MPSPPLLSDGFIPRPLQIPLGQHQIGQPKPTEQAAQQVEARNQFSLGRVALSEVIGRPDKEELSGVRNDVELKVSAESLEGWVNLAIADNLAIKASENALEAAKAALCEGKGAHYPMVSLSLSAQQSNEGYNNLLAP